MNKTDKEYVDAQIEGIEQKFEERLDEVFKQVCNQKPLPTTSEGYPIIPVGFTQRKGEPLIIMDPDTLESVSVAVFRSFLKKQLEYEEKQKQEGKLTREEWYSKLYNNNAEYWGKVSEQVCSLYNNGSKSLNETKQSIQSIKDDISGIKHMQENLRKDAIDKHGVYICGKHVSGWFFFPFMVFVFIFLGLFGYEAFNMRSEAIQANVKLQVIRDDFGHVPSVKRTFEMLDSTFANPVPPQK